MKRASIKVKLKGEPVPPEHVLRVSLVLELDSRTIEPEKREDLFNSIGRALAIAIPEGRRAEALQQIEEEKKRVLG